MAQANQSRVVGSEAIRNSGLTPIIEAPPIPRALFFFNMGVESGQLGFIAVTPAIIAAIGSLRVSWPSWAAHIPAYAIGSVAALWFLQLSAPILH